MVDVCMIDVCMIDSLKNSFTCSCLDVVATYGAGAILLLNTTRRIKGTEGAKELIDV